MSQHPLLDLVADPKVRRASDFRAVAAGITGAALAEAFDQEARNAPRRHDGGRKHFVAYSRRLAAERKPSRDGEHLSLALVDHYRRSGAGLALPGGAGTFDAVAAQVASSVHIWPILAQRYQDLHSPSTHLPDPQ